MANVKISELPAASAANAGDELPANQGGTSRKVTAGQIRAGLAASGANSDITSLSGLATPLSVGQGGTGSTSLPANNVLVGNGTSAVQVVAPGTSGNVLTSNGTTWVSQAAGASLAGVTDSATPFETSLGFEAGLNTTGVRNTFVGYQSGKSNTTGIDNAALGTFAGFSLTTGATNTLVGSGAGSGITTGSGNTGVGYGALGATNQQRNTAVGYWPLSETTGVDNTAIGYGVASPYVWGIGARLTGSSNVGIGSYALGSEFGDGDYSATRCVAVGFRALSVGGSGARNVAVGAGALSRAAVGPSASPVNGSDNVCVGDTSGDGITTGNQNTILGSGAGSSGTNDLTTGSNNMIIGFNAAASSASVSNEITLGNASVNTFRIPGLSVNWTSSTIPNVNTTATQTLTNKTINRAILNDGYTEEVFAITDGTTVNLDPNNGSIQTWTLGANRTPGQANWAAGQSITLMIDDGAAAQIIWTTLGVVWETNSGIAPTLATSGFTVIVMWKVGTTIYGARVGNA
jgi:hypothetical protein